MQNNNPNIMLATMLSVAVLIGWTWFVEMPKIEKQEEQRKIAQQQASLKKEEDKAINKKVPAAKIAANKKQPVIVAQTLDRSKAIDHSQDLRVKVENNNLAGSINLVGARFDDLLLKNYYKTTKKEENVVLFSPSNSKERYFSDFGWISSDRSIELPTPNTIWQSNKDVLKPGQNIELSWSNKSDIEFVIEIAIDQDYFFDVKQLVRNNSNADIVIAPYGRVNRVLSELGQAIYILHEGPIGVFDGILEEVSYGDLIEESSSSFSSKSGGWLGITDKYWMSTIVPDKEVEYKASFSHEGPNEDSKLFNVEYVGQEFLVKSGGEVEFNNHLYAGAKQVKLLDQYSTKYDIELFDRAVDFGWFYFLTKPFFFILQIFYKFLDNFGLAILAATILIKLLLFPMANKSYIAIGRIKKLQPKIEKIRKDFKDDKMAMNREMMDLYKREKVNPASGCLPALVQIPIFFALYKVLFVTIDMRHTPFYGWIQDLSAPDPTSIFNLFGLLPFEVSGFFSLGAWPIIMGITMVIQQKLNPPAADPMQAKILKWMPYIITLVLAAFPAGLVIYWTWNNILSILQQWFITKKLNKEEAK